MPEHAVFAVVLAAGESSRFGSTKQLTEYDGAKLAGRAVRLAEDGDPVIVIVIRGAATGKGCWRLAAR